MDKVIGPTQHVTFLGVDIDTVECTLSLGHEKLHKLHGILKTFKTKWRATKVQLQSLAVSLNWQTMLNDQFHKDLNWWLTDLDVCNSRQYYSDHAEESVDRCMQSGQWVLLGRRLALQRLSCGRATSSANAY